MWRRVILVVAMTMAVLAVDALRPRTTSWVRPRTIAAQNDCQTFPETGKAVCGIFLSYWRANGGLAQQGFPISDILKEESSDGKTYDTQYFERAVFERHPENAGTRFEVLLALLGRERFDRRYPAGLPSGETPLQAGQTPTLPGSDKNGTFRTRIDAVQELREFSEPCAGNPVRAKGKFVVAFLQIENLGNESDYLRGPKLKDNRGRLFDTGDYCSNVAASKQFNRSSYQTTVQPGLTADVVIVFDVAPDASGFTIVPPTP